MKTNVPKIEGMCVNGKRTDLTHYLLNLIDRPLPKAPTHYIVAEVLNTDLSIKRVSVYFNPLDTWKNSNSFLEPNAAGVGKLISENLRFLDTDPNTLAYKSWLVEIESDQVVSEYFTYSLNKCSY